MQIKAFLEAFDMFLTYFKPICRIGMLNMALRKVPQLFRPSAHLYGNSETATPLEPRVHWFHWLRSDLIIWDHQCSVWSRALKPGPGERTMGKAPAFAFKEHTGERRMWTYRGRFRKRVWRLCAEQQRHTSKCDYFYPGGFLPRLFLRC